MNKKLLFALGAVVTLASCEHSLSESDLSKDETSVSFLSAINAPKSRAVNNAFENGDEIGVFAQYNYESYADNVKYSFGGDKFTSATPISLTAEAKQLAYYAIYPYTDDAQLIGNFNVYTDQSVADNYTKSDMMSAYAWDTDETCPKLFFNHNLVKIEVNFSSDIEASDAQVSVMAKSSVDYNVQYSNFDAVGEVEEIKAASNGENSFKVVIAPQTFEAGAELFKFSVGGAEYSWVVSDQVSLYSGCKYSCNVELSSGEISFSGDISNWNDGGEIDVDANVEQGDQAKEYSLADFSDSSFTPEGNYWSITDSEATTEDFTALNNAMSSLESVSIILPNMEVVPESAMVGVESLVAVEMPIVKSILPGAFASCTNLKDVVAPEVILVGDGAFYYNINLGDINFPAAKSIGVSSFAYSGVTSALLPEVEVINSESFCGCANLKSVDFKMLTSVPAHAFVDCAALEAIDLPSAYSIEAGAFSNCSSLKSAKLDIAQSIGEASFYMCKGLAELYSPEVQSVSANAFHTCESLVTVDMPKVMSIADYGFYSCSALESISLDQLTSTSACVFVYCSSLKDIYAPNLVSVATETFVYCTSLESIELPSVKSIASGTFRFCTSLHSASFPNAVSLEDRVFADCDSLRSLELSTASGVELKSIGNNLFTNFEGKSNEYYVALTIGSANSGSVNNNVLTVGGVSYSFYSISVVEN